MSLLLTGGNIVDATRPEPRGDAWVLMDGTMIREVGQGRAPRAERGSRVRLLHDARRHGRDARHDRMPRLADR